MTFQAKALVRGLSWLCPLLFPLFFLFFSCSGSSGGGDVEATGSSVPVKWTVIAYIDGNNNLDITSLGSSFYIRKVQDMEKIGSTDDVKVVTMVSSKKTGNTAQYYHIEKHIDELPDNISSTQLENVGTVDMSDPVTLVNFVEFVLDREEYQAEHYMLIIADHGEGWKGICLDDAPNGVITMKELNSALTEINHKFDIIAFDACLMGMVEVAHEIAEFADYMVASQNVTWATIDLGYPEWLGNLVSEPDMDPVTLSKNIADAVYNEGIRRKMDVTTSVIELSKMQHLCSVLARFASDLATMPGTDPVHIQIARENCFEEQNAPHFVDLKQFAGNVKNDPYFADNIKQEADDVMNAITDSTVYIVGNVQYPRNGLSIYFPKLSNQFTPELKIEYADIKFKESNWYIFIDAYINTFGGVNGSTSNSLSGTVIWPGQTFSPNAFAFLDSSETDEFQMVCWANLDPATGAYTFNLQLDAPLTVSVWACDDLDGDGNLDALGFWDVNNDGVWSVDDMITIYPGEGPITGADIYL